MAAETGMRLEELLSLRWEQVDLERREVRLVITKTNRPGSSPSRIGPLAVSCSQRWTPGHFTLCLHQRSDGKPLQDHQEGFQDCVSSSGDHELPLA